ncbi:hypothetical protein D3C84_800040 [compost metagenome]
MEFVIRIGVHDHMLVIERLAVSVARRFGTGIVSQVAVLVVPEVFDALQRFPLRLSALHVVLQRLFLLDQLHFVPLGTNDVLMVLTVFLRHKKLILAVVRILRFTP